MSFGMAFISVFVDRDRTNLGRDHLLKILGFSLYPFHFTLLKGGGGSALIAPVSKLIILELQLKEI